MMTSKQERHLLLIQRDFSVEVDAKYRAGAKEHGGDLMSKTPSELIEMAMQECIDQYVYLWTLRDSLQ